MERSIRHLGILLAAQLMLALILFFSGPDLAAVRPDTPLLHLGDKEVNRLIIEGDEDKKVVLSKEGEQWRLPDHFAFPADKQKADRLLTRLKGLKHGLPVATSSGALQRFKVTAEAFERRITLAKNDDTLATVFLGTSPGMRRMHARTESDDAVFSILFAAHEAPAQAEDWEDKEILVMPEGEIEKIRLSDLSLVRRSKAKAGAVATEKKRSKSEESSVVWHSETIKAGESLQTEAVEKLARNLANLRIGKVLGIESKQTYRLNTPKLTLSLTRKGKGDVTYQLGEHTDGDFFVLKVSTRSEYFRIAKYTAEQLLKASSRGELVKSLNTEEPKEAIGDTSQSHG